MNKNITLSADEALIRQGRRRAASENTTLQKLFRQWLAQYVAEPSAPSEYAGLMERLAHVEAGRAFSREEMNERR